MEQETAIPAMDEATQKSKCAFFPTLYIVEGEQGLNFPSILSKIVGHLICANKRHDCIIDLPKWSKWGTEIIWIKKISFKYLTLSAIVHVDFLK